MGLEVPYVYANFYDAYVNGIWRYLAGW
jgi:hypothetical protein